MFIASIDIRKTHVDVNKMLSDVSRGQILASVLESVYTFSSREYQMRIWVRDEGPEAESFDDAVNAFDCEGGGVLEKWQQFRLTRNQFVLLKRLYDQVDVFADDNDYPELFIDTPEWQEIMSSAEKVLDAFGWNKETRKFV